MTDQGEMIRCPNGHEVPPWRTTCGVCDAPMPSAQLSEPAPADAAAGAEAEVEAETPTSRPGASKLAWAGLGLLALGALAIPFMQDDVVLADDFSQPAVLRTWPEASGTMEYGTDGRYHMTVPSQGGFPWAYGELPNEMGSVRLDVDVEAVAGRPVIAVLCVNQIEEVADPGGGVGVEDRGSYTFFYDPSRGGAYAIAGLDAAAPLAEGALPPGGSGRLSVSCAVSDGGTILTMRIGDGEPVSVTDEGAAESFKGVALGTVSRKSGDEVAFDDLRVTPA